MSTQTQNNTIILGIDPGFERLGIAVLEKSTKERKEQLLHSECFKTSKNLPFEERILLIGKRINEIIKRFRPNILAIETLFFTNNQKTAMRVAETRGVILYECKKAGLKIFEATPPQIKIATTGYGKADKKQIMKMVRMLIKIDTTKESDDELDAIAIAITGLSHLGR